MPEPTPVSDHLRRKGSTPASDERGADRAELIEAVVRRAELTEAVVRRAELTEALENRVRTAPGLAALVAEAVTTWRERAGVESSEEPAWRAFSDAFPTFWEFTNRPR